MTFSIVARCPQTGAFGIAVASRALAVGALCPFLRGGVGAVAAQGLANPILGWDALHYLEEGSAPDYALDAALAPDAAREHRQLHLIDRAGKIAAYTGPACLGWAGHVAAENVSVAGALLVGPDVVDAALTHFRQATRPLAQRLLAALWAAQAAGGDRRGKQSAALAVASKHPILDLDLRVDDHPEPLAELRRLFVISGAALG
jgi:uncharacterized Ntn-hydrolase superfamily protein